LVIGDGACGGCAGACLRRGDGCARMGAHAAAGAGADGPEEGVLHAAMVVAGEIDGLRFVRVDVVGDGGEGGRGEAPGEGAAGAHGSQEDEEQDLQQGERACCRSPGIPGWDAPARGALGGVAFRKHFRENI
jgi:hypothetical protein